MSRKIKYNDIFKEEVKSSNPEMTDLISNEEVPEINSGEIIKGKVTKVNYDFIAVDIGFKSEGLIPTSEFMDDKNNINLKVGDEVEVFLSSKDSKKGGIILSRTKANYIINMDKISNAFENGSLVEGKVISEVKGGLTMDLGAGIKAFMPSSQSASSDLKNLVGEKVKVKIADFKKSNIIVSRKKAIDEERRILRSELLPKIRHGAKFKGVVKSIKPYGLFVDIGGMDGLVHVSDISWGRTDNVKDLFSENDSIDVLILDYDRENEKLSLGIKQLTPDPWESLSYKEDDKVKGKVIGLNDYAAFVELEKGIEGVLHISEMSWASKIKKPSQILKKNDYIEAAIVSIDKENKKINLSLKKLIANPWDELKNKYTYGTKLKGKIKNITSFGMFVDIKEDMDGLVHISDTAWDEKERNLSNYKVGQDIEVVVLSIDSEKERLSLGIKQLTENPWQSIYKKYPKGKKVEGIITRIADFGIFVEIEKGIEGLIHISEISDEKLKKIPEEYKVSDKITSVVLSTNQKEKKISLSIKAVKEFEEKENMENFIKKQEDVKISLGELLKGRFK